MSFRGRGLKQAPGKKRRGPPIWTPGYSHRPRRPRRGARTPDGGVGGATSSSATPFGGRQRHPTCTTSAVILRLWLLSRVHLPDIGLAYGTRRSGGRTSPASSLSWRTASRWSPQRIPSAPHAQLYRARRRLRTCRSLESRKLIRTSPAWLHVLLAFDWRSSRDASCVGRLAIEWDQCVGVAQEDSARSC